MNHYEEKINHSKSKIINAMYGGLIILMIPVIIVLSIRSKNTGSSAVTVVVSSVFITLSILFIFREKVSTGIRVLVMIVGFFLIAIVTFIGLGLLSLGVTVLLIICIISALFYERKYTYIIFASCLMLMFAFSILSRSGILWLDFDVMAYFYGSSTWMIQLIGFAALALIAILAINTMTKILTSSMKQIGESELQYRTLLDNVDTMIYRVSTDGVFISVNNSFAQAANMDKETLIGMHILTLFYREDRKKQWHERVNRLIATKEAEEFRFDYVGGHGRLVIVNVKLIPEIDSDGNVMSILGTNTDITELVEASQQIEELLTKERDDLEVLVSQRTQELETTRDELVDKERLASLGSLVAGIAHEINTPLGVALSASSYVDEVNDKAYNKLQTGAMTKENLLKYMSTIDESAVIINRNLNRASELIKSFKQISVDQSAETKMVFNMSDYMDSILITLKHEYKNTKHRFDVQCSKALTINSYPGVYAQIFTNFIMNSLVHGFRDVEAGLITIKFHADDTTMTVSYIDNGVGMTEEHLKKVFDPFFTTNRSQGGSGLGMHIVYNLVTGKLNGKISCKSEIGKGIEFLLTVPL